MLMFTAVEQAPPREDGQLDKKRSVISPSFLGGGNEQGTPV